MNIYERDLGTRRIVASDGAIICHSVNGLRSRYFREFRQLWKVTDTMAFIWCEDA